MSSPFIARRGTPLQVRLPSRVGERDGPSRGAAGGPRWRRTGPGLFVPSDLARPPEQHVVEAVVPMPEAACVTAWAALLLHGATFFSGVESLVDVVVPRQTHPRSRSGVRWHRRQAIPAHEVLAGIPTAPAPEALLDEVVRLVSDGRPREAVVAVDMTLLAELCTRDDLSGAVDARRGIRHRGDVERVLSLAVGGSESPPETYLRLLWVLDTELPPPVMNTWVCDERGRPQAVPDLLEPESGLVVEYDGSMHAGLQRRTRDAAKDDIYRELGLEQVRLTAIDMRSPSRVRQRLLRAHARAQEWVRPRRWSLGQPLRGACDRFSAAST